jgi:hypothetical protein
MTAHSPVLAHCYFQPFCIGWKTQDRFKELTGETLAMGHCLKTLTLEMDISVETHSSGTCIRFMVRCQQLY